MSLVRSEIEAGVATVTLADPDRRNALSLPMVTEIMDLFDGLEADPAVGAVVVTGEAAGYLAGVGGHPFDSRSSGCFPAKWAGPPGA